MRSLLLLTLVLTVVNVTIAEDDEPERVTGKVTVSDGDTLKFETGEKVRLWGFDAPESKQKCSVEDSCYACGREAANVLRELIGNSEVTCTETGGVSYGRIVGVCYAGEVNLNETMVRKGWGVAYTRYTPAFVASEYLAWEEERGIWRGDFILPERWRRGHRLNGCE